MTCGMCAHHAFGKCNAPAPLWAMGIRFRKAGMPAEGCNMFADCSGYMAEQMISAGANNHEIAQATGKSEEAIRVKRYRMKKAGKI